MLEREQSALAFDGLLPNRPGGVDQNVPKDLFGKVPVFGGGPSADIGRIEEWRNEHPRVLNDLFGVTQRKWDGNIGPRPDASEPALCPPAGEKLRGLRAGKRKSGLNIGDINDIARRVDNGGQI